eukprot:3323054-Amphidinium_carterae.1
MVSDSCPFLWGLETAPERAETDYPPALRSDRGRGVFAVPACVCVCVKAVRFPSLAGWAVNPSGVVGSQ